MKHFLPGVQGEAKVCPSLASVPVSLSEHLWVGVEKPSREVPSSQSHALRQRPDKTWFVPPFITACSPFPEIVCMLWMASLGIPGGPAEAWDVLVAVPRWLTSGLCFQGVWDLCQAMMVSVLPSWERRDGLLVAWSSRVLTQPLWLHEQSGT